MAHKGKKFSTKFQRPVHFQNWFHADILSNQQTDANGEIADTLLICNGGTIRAHAFLLQAASPFFQSAIASQGENYPFVREILIPDFRVKLMELVVGLIYKGFVDVKGDEEVSKFKEALEFFQITSVDYSKERTHPIKGAVKIQETNRIPQDIFKKAEKSELDDSKPHVVVVDVKRNGRGKVSDIDSDEDYVPNGVSPPRRRGRSAVSSTQPVVKLARIESLPKAQADPGPSVALVPAASVALVPGPRKVYKPDDTDQSDSSTDTEDEGWEAPNYKDVDWFEETSRTCQRCKKKHERPQDASLCVTSHKKLRCYFCFTIYTTTDILFRHFKRRHKSAGRESTLICPFCDVPVPYKSVSCHVISSHLGKMRQGPEDEARREINGAQNVVVRTGPGRPPSIHPIQSAPSSRAGSVATEVIEVSPPKKKRIVKKIIIVKRKKKRVPVLNITINKTTAFGKKLSFTIQKERLVPPPDAKK